MDIKKTILFAEFMGRKFKAYADNQSYNQDFETFDSCQEWIDNNTLKGMSFSPHLGWGDIYGDYHCNWNSLMLVVEKIQMLDQVRAFNIDGNKSHGKYFNAILIVLFNQDRKDITYYGDDKIKGVYDCCVEFIEWYNENKK